jgi:hypothetical protein
VIAAVFTTTRSEIICRHAKSSQRVHWCTTGWCTAWAAFSVTIFGYQADLLPPPRTLTLDFTLTHTRYDSSHVHTTGQLTNTRRSDDTTELDGVLREVPSDHMMILVVYYSFTLAVKLRLWLTKFIVLV